jgi:hypothetical protein
MSLAMFQSNILLRMQIWVRSPPRQGPCLAQVAIGKSHQILRPAIRLLDEGIVSLVKLRPGGHQKAFCFFEPLAQPYLKDQNMMLLPLRLTSSISPIYRDLFWSGTNLHQ